MDSFNTESGASAHYVRSLPGLKGLGGKIYLLIDTRPGDIEQEAFKNNQIDATRDLLERRLPRQHHIVCKALAETLESNLHRKGFADARRTAFLSLAGNYEGALRLVTANLDHLLMLHPDEQSKHFMHMRHPCFHL